jgi:hypothetical protein
MEDGGEGERLFEQRSSSGLRQADSLDADRSVTPVKGVLTRRPARCEWLCAGGREARDRTVEQSPGIQ